MPHQLGVTGQEALLLRDAAPPLAARFRDAGYRTVLCGRLMVLNDPREMGFTEQLEATREEQVATAAAFIEAPGGARRVETSSDAERTGALQIHAPNAGTGRSDHGANRPFLLSVSFTQCHRPFGDRSDPEVAERVEVPPYLPDTEATRRDLATPGVADPRPGPARGPDPGRPRARRAGKRHTGGVHHRTRPGNRARQAHHLRLRAAHRPAAAPAGRDPGGNGGRLHDQQRRPAAHPHRPVRPARPHHRRHQLGHPPHRRRHARGAPVRIQRVQLGEAQRALVLHAEPGDPRRALQADPRLPAHPDLRRFRLAGALRRRP